MLLTDLISHSDGSGGPREAKERGTKGHTRTGPFALKKEKFPVLLLLSDTHMVQN